MKPVELKRRLLGILSIVITPFKKDYELDLAGFRSNLEFLIANGVHGVVIGGSLGEFSSLSNEERKRLFEASVDHVNGRLPVIVCTGHSNTREAVELTKYAEEVGADGVLIPAPYYALRSEEGVYRHYAEIADKTSIGIVAYNTVRSGFNMTPKFIKRLTEIDSVVGIKQGTRDITEQEETVSIVGDRLAVIAGSEVMMLPCFALGAVASTSTSSCFMPKLMVRTYTAAAAGDYDLARELFYKWDPFRRFMQRVGMPAAVKAAMDVLGLAGGPVRLPLLSATEEHREEVKSILREIGVEHLADTGLSPRW